MPKVRFLRTVTVKDATAATYREGYVYELSEDSAQHWVRRNVAELVDPPENTQPVPIDGPPEPEPAKEPEKPTDSPESRPEPETSDEPEDELVAAGIKPEDAEKLRAGGVTTVEQVRSHPDLTELDGIGDVTAARVLEAVGAE